MDYALKLVKEANEKNPAVYEITNYIKAVDVEGKEVMIQGQKANITLPMVSNQIGQLEAQIAKLKSIKADLEK